MSGKTDISSDAAADYVGADGGNERFEPTAAAFCMAEHGL
jgi:hypothetical protein